MAYICQNCGVTANDRKTLCNPITDEDNGKLCKDRTYNVCRENASEMEYSCICGNVSADPQYLCNPTRMWEP